MDHWVAVVHKDGLVGKGTRHKDGDKQLSNVGKISLESHANFQETSALIDVNGLKERAREVAAKCG